METKNDTLAEQLSDDCQSFLKQVHDLSETQFAQHSSNKWSVAEVIQHLYLSARPVARLMIGPREVFAQWGKAEAPSRTYDDLTAAYLAVLGTGAKAPASMTPRPEDMQIDKAGILDRFTSVYQALTDALGEWSEQELDTYCIPHPALGKLTVREMLYFTSLHTRHHLRLL